MWDIIPSLKGRRESSFENSRTNLEDIVIHGINMVQKKKYYMITLICGT